MSSTSSPNNSDKNSVTMVIEDSSTEGVVAFGAFLGPNPFLLPNYFTLILKILFNNVKIVS